MTNNIELTDDEMQLLDDCLEHCSEHAVTSQEFTRMRELKSNLLKQWTANE